MKIALLSFYSGKIDRGVEVSAGALAKGLGVHHDVTLYQGGKKKLFGVKSIELTQRVWKKDTSSSFLRRWYLDYYSRQIFVFTLRFIPFFLHEKYDLILPTNGGWQVLIIRLLTWIFRKKMIVQGNAGIGRDDHFQLLMRPDVYIAISPQGYSWAKSNSGSVKVVYIPHGVDIEKIKSTKPAHLQLTKPIVLCVGAFLPYKRIELLLRAMQKVPSASLLLIGHGPLKEQLQDMGVQLLGERFLMLTDVTHDKLPQYYRSAELFSLPSKESEALGIVYLEALAADLKLVVPDDDHRRSLLGETACYVDVTNIEAYAAAIKSELKSKNREFQQKFIAQFSWQEIILKYEEILASL